MVLDEVYFVVVSVDGDAFLIRKSKLSQGQVRAISEYNPGYFNEVELPNHVVNLDDNINQSEVPNEHMKEFVAQLREVRQEQQELYKELNEIRSQVENNIEFEVQKDMQTLRDDVQFFTAENLELRLKIKALVLQNLE